MTYLVTTADRVSKFCPLCACARFVFVCVDDDGVEKTCCTVCQGILAERRQ